MSFSDFSAGTAAVSFISTVIFSIPDWMYNPWFLPFVLIGIAIIAGLLSHKVNRWVSSLQARFKEMIHGF